MKKKHVFDYWKTFCNNYLNENMLHIILKVHVQDKLQPNIQTLTQIMKSLTRPNVKQFLVCLRTFLTWEKLRILVELVHDDPVVIWQLVQIWFMIINEYNYFWTVIFLLWNIYKIGNENPKNALFNNTVGQHDTFMKNGLICAVRSFWAVHDTYQSKVCVMVRLCSRVS